MKKNIKYGLYQFVRNHYVRHFKAHSGNYEYMVAKFDNLLNNKYASFVVLPINPEDREGFMLNIVFIE